MEQKVVLDTALGRTSRIPLKLMYRVLTQGGSVGRSVVARYVWYLTQAFIANKAAAKEPQVSSICHQQRRIHLLLWNTQFVVFVR
jgi:hypothetical protein